MKVKLFLMLVLMYASGQSHSQDLNQTNYRYAPLYLNPSLTGNYLGNLRFGASIRDQYRSFISDSYSTQQLFCDLPFNFGFRKNDWIGLGLHMYKDEAGTAALSTTGALLSLAYHFAMDKKYSKVFSISAQYGMLQKKIDASKIIIESTFRPDLAPNAPKDLSMLDQYNSSYSDLNFGINYKSMVSKSNEINIGFSAFHILNPKFKALKSMNFVNRRLSFNADYKSTISKRISIKPALIISFSDNANNISPQFTTFYKLIKDKTNTDQLYFGLGYRVQDALQFMVGMNYKKWDFGISYDVTTSQAALYDNHKGAIELGIYRIIDFHKKPSVKPIIICPRL